MAYERTTVFLGIPVPSTDPIFLAIVGVHVVLGLSAVIAGAAAMFSTKGRGRHSRSGKAYFWLLLGVFVTMSILSAMRWSPNRHLFVLGALSFLAGCSGRIAAARYESRWLRLHVVSMGASYVLMLTAFYVDNGRNLPLWRDLPRWMLWVLPAAVGFPLILRAFFRHPLILASLRSRMDAPPPTST